MPESATTQHVRRRRGILVATVVVAALVATGALAATVTQPPSISGTPEPGSVLTASTGTWTPASATAEYTWLRCDESGSACVGITGACGRRYAVRTADENHTLRARLTVTEGAQADARDSAQTAAVLSDPYKPHVDDSDTCTKVTPTGPGRGTFTSGTETGGGSEPAPDTSLPFIDPFPVVRIAGRFNGKRTRLTRVTVRAPKGTRIRFNCKGHGCPYKRKAVAVRLIRVRSLQRTYRPRATIEVRVTEPNKIGKYTRVRTRSGKAPVRIDRCLMPGKSRPVKCPAE